MSRQEIRGTVRSTSRSLASPRVINVHDLRHLAQARLPRVVFDYLDGGAESEVTLRENCRIFDDVTFRPRQAVAIPECDLHTRVLSADLAFPAILAPIGYSRLMHPGGEVAAAASAEEAGLAYTLSTISGHKLENVRAASNAPVWYQLYLVGGREVAEGAIDRARRAGFSALVVTIDTPMAGMCERDPRNGIKELLGGSIFSRLPFLPQMFTHPRWLVPFLMDGGVPKLENIVIPGKGPMSLIDPGCRHLGRHSLAQAGLDRADCRQRGAYGRRWETCRRRRGSRDCCLQSRWASTGRSSSHLESAPRSCSCRQRPGRSPHGWRCSPWQRHRKGDLSWRSRRSVGTCLRFWSCRRWKSRSYPRARDFA